MAKLKFFIAICAILCSYLILANCQCTIQFPDELENFPRYRKRFGLWTIPVHFKEGSVVLQNDEQITGYCATGFSAFSQGANEVTLHCRDNWLYQFGTNNYFEKNAKVSCRDLQWNVYTTAALSPWCEPITGSFMLAAEYRGGFLKLAATCFDVTKKELSVLHYRTGSKQFLQDHHNLTIIESTVVQNEDLSEKIDHFKLDFKHPNQGTLDAELQFLSILNYLIDVPKYEFQPIVQGGPFVRYFQAYTPILDIIWWSNLRRGNWKRFVGALDERAETVTYNIFTGTSGAVRVPESNKKGCMHWGIPNLKLERINTTVPEYIWMYLQAESGSENFVVVGYNSPFYEFFAEKEVIFCEDICEKISWLNDVRSTFRYSVLGVTFCCSVEAVRSANLLDGFPIEAKALETTTTQTPKILTETTSSVIQSDEY